jgi:hypothetical protein
MELMVVVLCGQMIASEGIKEICELGAGWSSNWAMMSWPQIWDTWRFQGP